MLGFQPLAKVRVAGFESRRPLQSSTSPLETASTVVHLLVSGDGGREDEARLHVENEAGEDPRLVGDAHGMRDVRRKTSQVWAVTVTTAIVARRSDTGW